MLHRQRQAFGATQLYKTAASIEAAVKIVLPLGLEPRTN